MKTALRLALVGASILALTAPTIARTTTKGDRTVSRYTAVKPATVAPSRPTASIRSGTDWDFLAGYDRASSPYGHDGF